MVKEVFLYSNSLVNRGLNPGVTFFFSLSFSLSVSKIYQYAKFDENTWCGSRGTSIFTKRPQPAKTILSNPSSIKNGCYTCQWFDNVGIH